MDDDPNPKQIFVGQWMFVDMERREEPFYLIDELPLYKQRWWGYGIVNDFSKNQSYGSVPRAPRSLHNHAFKYLVCGRHFPHNPPTYDDLAIFYYGYASLEEGSIKRKMQIQTQCPGGGHGTNHHFDLNQLLDRFRKEQQPMSRDLRNEIKRYIDAHEAWAITKGLRAQAANSQEHIKQAQETLHQAIETLNNALNNK
jgi:hypothetical protein